MTREETIKYLKKMKDECNDTFHKVRYVTREEALEKAIKALEQEPCEDCITLRLEKGTLKYSDEDYVVYKKEWLKKWWQPELAMLGIELPSIQPKPKTGHWIVDEYGIKHCPFCNAINNTVYDSYCPNCGARMESEE